MNPPLFAILYEKISEFMESDERCNDATFFVDNDTTILMAKAAAAVYDGMAHADKLAEENQED